MKIVALMLVVCVAQASAWFFTSNDKVVNPTDAVNATCEALAAQGDCEFFKCFERRFQCGQDYYMKKFAQKYCRKFNMAMNTFDPAGRQFLVNSRSCVMTRLLLYYRQDRMNCDTLQDDAVQMTTPCYLENNFCDIIDNNAQSFISVFEFGDASSLISELARIAGSCGGNALSGFWNTMSGHVRGSLARFFGVSSKK